MQEIARREMPEMEGWESSSPLIPNPPVKPEDHTGGINGKDLVATLKAPAAPAVISQTGETAPAVRRPIEATRGRLVRIADLETRQLARHSEPQLVEKERPFHQVHVVVGDTRNQLGMVRIISTAPPKIGSTLKEIEPGEMAESADWGD